ncbi:NOD26-like intrinsic protein 3;1 [Actinidia rufa]|uniref:NOD26-like intrinsic protein 31 n=1 Tax=Actinidia rufa TaxID=165716 RepID=A0A7J0EY47_9ERIC|nr:NOD26-like intrinsic protein 3;1 [Actinidia rufa]
MGINMETMEKKRLFSFPNLIKFDIMAGIFASPIRCSPLPQLSLGNNDLSRVEEGKFSPPQESTEDIVVVAPTIAPKGILITIIGESAAWGFSVMIMIYTLGHVSGGHFNSAVTIAFAASGRFPWREVSNKHLH